MEKSQILIERDYYKPFEYPKAFDFWLTQQQSFWLHTEINMDKDIEDWKFRLTDDEKLIIGNILKSFVQSEVLIGDYWRAVAKIFKKPEISMMATSFSNSETIHIASYAYLNDVLGLQDFKAFLQDEIAMERLSTIQTPPRPLRAADNYEEWLRKLTLSLAVFSAFGEGVSLYSAFTVLLSFSMRGLMKGVGEIIEYSHRDEAQHSKGGMWLFNELISENKGLTNIKKPVYEAARIAVKVEDDFIDSVFDGRSLPNCTAYDLKQFIRQRANNQLEQIGLKPIFKSIDKDAVDRLSWFNMISGSENHADFFSGKVTEYGMTSEWESMYD